MTFDPTKPVQTRDKRKAREYIKRLEATIAALKEQVNIPKRKVWVNVHSYRSLTSVAGPYDTREEADKAAARYDTRVACAEIEWEESVTAEQDKIVEIMARALAGDGHRADAVDMLNARAIYRALTAAGCEVVRWRPIAEATLPFPWDDNKTGIGFPFSKAQYKDMTHFAILRGPQGGTP